MFLALALAAIAKQSVNFGFAGWIGVVSIAVFLFFYLPPFHG
jgi:hypothetical protein